MKVFKIFSVYKQKRIFYFQLTNTKKWWISQKFGIQFLTRVVAHSAQKFRQCPIDSTSTFLYFSFFIVKSIITLKIKKSSFDIFKSMVDMNVRFFVVERHPMGSISNDYQISNPPNDDPPPNTHVVNICLFFELQVGGSGPWPPTCQTVMQKVFLHYSVFFLEITGNNESCIHTPRWIPVR